MPIADMFRRTPQASFLAHTALSGIPTSLFYARPAMRGQGLKPAWCNDFCRTSVWALMNGRLRTMSPLKTWPAEFTAGVEATAGRAQILRAGARARRGEGLRTMGTSSLDQWVEKQRFSVLMFRKSAGQRMRGLWCTQSGPGQTPANKRGSRAQLRPHHDCCV